MAGQESRRVLEGAEPVEATQHTPGPYIWLQPDETEGSASCGCFLQDNDGSGARLWQCATHGAAPALIAALRYAQGEACGGCGDCLICTTLREVEQ